MFFQDQHVACATSQLGIGLEHIVKWLAMPPGFEFQEDASKTGALEICHVAALPPWRVWRRLRLVSCEA